MEMSFKNFTAFCRRRVVCVCSQNWLQLVRKYRHGFDPDMEEVREIFSSSPRETLPASYKFLHLPSVAHVDRIKAYAATARTTYCRKTSCSWSWMKMYDSSSFHILVWLRVRGLHTSPFLFAGLLTPTTGGKIISGIWNFVMLRWRTARIAPYYREWGEIAT